VAEHPDVQRFRQALEARTDASVQDLFADDVVWHGGGSGGDASGKDAVVRQWADSGGSGLSVSEVYADGVHTIGRLERTDNGRTIQQALVFHVDDGKATEIWSVPSDGDIADALASGGSVPDHRNLPVFRTAEETRGRNTFEPDDIANIEAFLREDVQWISAWGPGPSSRDECIAQFKGFLAATGGTLHMDVFSTFADDAHALSFVRLTATHPEHPDRHMDFKEVNLFHLDENGQAYEFWGVQDDPDEANAFWAP
jgi:SnoaL-like domain